MIRSLLSVRAGKPSQKQRKQSKCPRATRRPLVAYLEDRCLPSTLLWIATANGHNWSEAQNNWYNENTGMTQGNVNTGDNLVFNPDLSFGGNQGSNKDSTDNINFLTIGQFTIASHYSSTVHINNNGLTANGLVNIASTLAGILDLGGAGLMTVSGACSGFTWSEGAINNGTLLLKTSTTIVSSSGERTMSLLVFENNSGTVSWNSGIISLSTSTIQNDAGANFHINFNGAIDTIGSGNVINSGTFKQVSGSGTTTIAPSFTNQAEGLFEIDTGLVNLTSASTYQTGGITRLNGGKAV